MWCTAKPVWGDSKFGRDLPVPRVATLPAAGVIAEAARGNVLVSV